MFKSKNQKLNIKFLIVFLALVGIYFLLQQANNNPDKKLMKLSHPEKINKIEIINNNSIIILVKEGDSWVVSGPDGQKEPDADLLNNLTEILFNEMELEKISNNVEKYSLYELDDNQIAYLKIYQGDKLIQEWGVGKMGSVYPSSFIKLKEDPNIYQTNNFLTFLVRSSDWVEIEKEENFFEVESE